MQRRATALQKTAEKEVREYTYYNEKLTQESYAGGDVYNDEVTGDKIQRWELPSTEDRPYLSHIKNLSRIWPSLRLLADFMEIGTSPVRWSNMEKQSPRQRAAERRERASRATITRLEYSPSGIIPQEYNTILDLRKALNDELQESEANKGRFRLYIVEDLSRDVIELLGGHYDIEPAFFREQIFDYAWYNLRDRWFDPPRLKVTTKNQRWLQLRFPTIRYYKTAEEFTRGSAEYENFNVYRRHEDDINNTSKWDDKNAKVGLARSRVSLWLSGEGRAGKASGSVGILLCDPTPKCGRPLWYGYRNWSDTPSMSSKERLEGPPRTSRSIYHDLVYWSQVNDTSDSPLSTSHIKKLKAVESVQIPIQGLLRLLSAEWVEVSEYICWYERYS
ncbi:hypothetical protein HYFRA_00009449 [Hymenoscyphus fraxineus]|uniref:Uncharacterized protein n=1 Tax=Hymenoscyphus fraxineus TaxID=746836 RepID=A0A9N9PX35_9HELO|nr:hypothetical protein HYFRA_00009449 [Hymenoscyphus fraxineus]